MMHVQMAVWLLGNGLGVQFIHVKFKMPIRSPRGDVGTTFIGQEREESSKGHLRSYMVSS